MKTILSIDFDIIMAPSIELYNSLVPNMSWDELIKNPQMALNQIDTIHYKRLSELLLNQTKTLHCSQFHFIYDHQQIVKYIPKQEEIKLINIDHHHDAGYISPEKLKESLIGQSVNCANWVKWLIDNNYYIKDSIWIKNNNSIMPIAENSFYITNYFNLQDIPDLTNFIGPVDEIIICLSAAWVPPKYCVLYYIWIEILNHIYKYHFQIETVEESEKCGILMHENDKKIKNIV